MQIIKQELQFEESLKQRLEFICEFAKVSPTFINGSIRKLEKTNLTYIEPHKVIIKNITFLVFNYSNPHISPQRPRRGEAYKRNTGRHQRRPRRVSRRL